MSYTSADRHYERHATRDGTNTYYVGESGKKHYDHPAVPQENLWVTAIACVAFIVFACVWAAR